MYCVQCGTKNPEDARFCKQCGRKMEPPGEESDSLPVEAAHTPVSPAELVPDPEARYSELMARAFAHYMRGEYEHARDACRDALDLKPDSAESHALLSTVYERLGEVDKAIAERERVVELNPSSLADKEKLEALRAGIAQTAQRRIVSVRGGPTTFWDSPIGAAVAAIGAAVVVIIIGYAVLAYRDAQERREAASSVAQTQLPQAGSVLTPAPTQQPSFSGAPPSPPVQQQPPPQQPALQESRQPQSSQPSGLAPLPVRPQQEPLEAQASPPAPGSGGGSFFDPGQPVAPGGGNTPANPPTQGPGRIEIVVGPQPGSSANPSPNTPPNTSSAQMESRNNAAIAQNLQLAGRYKEAAQAWERALAGAGDGAPGYHQKAALCYQRIGDKANARRHYAEAIRGFREAMDRGVDKEAAQQAIQACEAGLRLCQ